MKSPISRTVSRAATLGVATLGAILLGACSSDETTGPSTPAPSRETQIAAAAFARTTAFDVLVFQAFSGALAGASDSRAPIPGLSADLSYGGMNCYYSSSAGHHVCDPTTLNAGTPDSVRLEAEYWLWADDVIQTGYDDATTDSAQVTYRAAGTMTNPAGAATIERNRTLRVSDLGDRATTRTFNGAGVDTTVSAPGSMGGDSTYVLTDETEARDVVFQVPFFSNVWPKSGTLTTHSTLALTTGGSTTTTTRTIVITFDGTQMAAMDVDGTLFDLNLATGALTARE
jgi:hypothetical protein